MKIYRRKIAFVTGAASGIGRAVCEQLASHGAIVVATDIDEDTLLTTAESIRDAGGEITTSTLDVTNAEAVAELIHSTAQQHGRVDYVFNNAGIAIVGEMNEMSLEDWYRQLDVNLRGVIHGIHAAYPLMIEQGFGHIVNTASVSGLVPTPGLGAYSATKHAVVGISRALRVEGAAHGVRVTAVCPGLVRTPIVQNLDFAALRESEPDRDILQERFPFDFYPVDKCAQAILKGVARNKAILVIAPHAHLLHGIQRVSSRAFFTLAGLASKRMIAMMDDADQGM